MRLGVRELLVLGLLLAMLAGVYGAIFARDLDRRAALAFDTQSRRRKLDDLRMATGGLDALNRKLDALQQSIRFAEAKDPRTEAETVREQIERLATANGLTEASVDLVKRSAANGYVEQPIEVTAKGDFPAFYSFLLELEKLPRLMRVTQVNIKKIGGDSLVGRLQMSVFFLPQAHAG